MCVFTAKLHHCCNLDCLSHNAPGLAIGDVPNNQPIGIVLTVLGVVVLDFCADATEGPIRAYLLDVADTEEQDMALNIHAFSSGTHTHTLTHTYTYTHTPTHTPSYTLKQKHTHSQSHAFTSATSTS